MTVYVDGVFLLNALLDCLLLLSGARLGGGQARWGRLLLSGAVGGLYSAAALWPALGFLQSPGMKAVVFVLMCLCAYGWDRRTPRLAALFLASSFVFCGAVLLAAQLFGTGLLLLNGSAYYPVSAGALLLLAGLLYLLSRLTFAGIGEHGGGELVPLTFALNGRTLSLCALRDTGNTLRDPITGEPACVANWQGARTLLPEADCRAEEFRQPAALMERLAAQYPALRFRLLPYRAVGTGSGLLLAVRCRAVRGKDRDRAALLAFSPTPVSDGGNFNALTGG